MIQAPGIVQGAIYAARADRRELTHTAATLARAIDTDILTAMSLIDGRSSRDADRIWEELFGGVDR